MNLIITKEELEKIRMSLFDGIGCLNDLNPKQKNIDSAKDSLKTSIDLIEQKIQNDTNTHS